MKLALSLLLVTLQLVIVAPGRGWADGNNNHAASKKRALKKIGPREKRALIAASNKKATPTAAPRRVDLFRVAPQEINMEGNSSTPQQLSEAQIERVMSAHQTRFDPCLLQSRRSDPSLKQAQIEFVVAGNGQVLATRVNGLPQSPLARCIDKEMRTIRFPATNSKRFIAAYTLPIPQ